MIQPNKFINKLLTNICLSLQIKQLVPEEFDRFFCGELLLPIEDIDTINEIDRLDKIIEKLNNFDYEDCSIIH